MSTALNSIALMPNNIERLRKVAALAERGVGGEKTAAQAKLKEMELKMAGGPRIESDSTSLAREPFFVLCEDDIDTLKRFLKSMRTFGADPVVEFRTVNTVRLRGSARELEELHRMWKDYQRHFHYRCGK